MKSEKKHILKIMISSVLCFVVLISMFIVLLFHNYQQERDRYYYIALNEVENVMTVVDCVMARIYTMRAMVRDHAGDTTFFEEFGREIYNSVKEETGVSLKNVALAPDGIVTMVYPLSGNEYLLGFNFMDDKMPGNRAAIEAYQKGKTILTNPFELVQGGKGIAGRAPVFVEREGKEVLWGLVTVTMDYENLIDVLRFDNLRGMGIEYRLSFVEEEQKQVMVERGTLDKNPVTITFKVRNLDWELEVMPEGGWLNLWKILPGLFLILLLSAAAGVLTKMFLELRESNRRLAYLSYQDGLTDTFSRNYLKTVLVDFESGDWREEHHRYSLMIIDIDDFKKFNDKYGHDVGDRVIVAVAKVLKKFINEKKGDCVVRFGGDEFIVLLNNRTKESISRMTLNIKEEVGNLEIPGRREIKVSVSGGVAMFEEMEDHRYQTLMQIADERLYEAKRKGKNQIELG